MPSDKKTTTDRPRRTGSGPAVSQRPIRPASPRPNAPLNQPPGKGRSPRNRSSLKAFWENLGWGLVIGLPIILVILAILWRATNGFQGTPSAADVPTPVPTPTAGSYVAPPAVPSGATQNRLLYVQAPDTASPMQIYTANLDGSNPTLLTNSAENKAGAVWSPDGKQVAFTANGAGIQLVNFDGSGLHTVAYGGFSPVWSPDSKQIAFLKSVPATDGQGPDNTGTVRVLYVINANGKPGDEKQLAADALGPNWSPDGKSIAFFSLRNAVMFTVEVATGKTQQIVLPEKLGGWYPTFSKDGNSFYFYGNPNPTAMVNGLDLSVAANSTTTVNTGAATPTPPATTAPASGTAASGTPAASASPTIAATPTPTTIPGPPSQTSLYQVNRDGSNLKKLQDLEPAGSGKFRFDYYIATSADLVSTLTNRTDYPYYKVGPVVSPDGKSVATLFINKDEKAGIAVVPVAGGNATLLVDGENNLEAGTRLNPTFSPDSARLYYDFTKPTATPAAGTATPAAASNSGRQVRYTDLSAKSEKTLFDKFDNSFLGCCGVNK
ncbi:MAG TPA: hypothetical protein VH186_02740 [Chloroflexia bacterium]|nr:hypothetical protein [Chloroflexia bacterium]